MYLIPVDFDTADSRQASDEKAQGGGATTGHKKPGTVAGCVKHSVAGLSRLASMLWASHHAGVAALRWVLRFGCSYHKRLMADATADGLPPAQLVWVAILGVPDLWVDAQVKKRDSC